MAHVRLFRDPFADDADGVIASLHILVDNVAHLFVGAKSRLDGGGGGVFRLGGLIPWFKFVYTTCSLWGLAQHYTVSAFIPIFFFCFFTC